MLWAINVSFVFNRVIIKKTKLGDEKMKVCFKSILSLVVIIGITLVVKGNLSHSVHAVGGHYYNGMTEPSAGKAYQKAKKVSNNDVIIKHYTKASSNQFKAVGRVSNKDGWKGRGKDSMGTGFMVDEHTFLTNAHVVENAKGQNTNPKYVTLDLNRDGKKIPYKFHATQIKKVPSYDIVLVHTKENMSKVAKVNPLKIASNSKINKLKFKDKLYSVGYPWQGDDNTKSYWNQLVYLQKSVNQAEIMTKDKFRSGASGSPMVNGNFEVVGLRTYGYNLRGNSTFTYAKQEVSGGESLYGYPQKYIKQNLK